MCVRCGTGRIAWCTDPNRHGDFDPKPVNTDLERFRATLNALGITWNREAETLRELYDPATAPMRIKRADVLEECAQQVFELAERRG